MSRLKFQLYAHFIWNWIPKIRFNFSWATLRWGDKYKRKQSNKAIQQFIMPFHYAKLCNDSFFELYFLSMPKKSVKSAFVQPKYPVKDSKQKTIHHARNQIATNNVFHNYGSTKLKCRKKPSHILTHLWNADESSTTSVARNERKIYYTTHRVEAEPSPHGRKDSYSHVACADVR